jgi:hypothetical protein
LIARFVGLFLAGAIAAAGGTAGWEARLEQDLVSGSAIEAAVGTSREGLTFAVMRQPIDSRVVGLLRLPAGNQDFFDASRPFSLRIDALPSRQIQRLDGELRSVSIVLWDGVGEPVLGPLRELMEGEELVIEYPLYGGGFKLAHFPLAGARDTIVMTLGVRATVSAEEKAQAAAFDAALASAVESCLALEKDKAKERCFARLGACRDARPATVEDFRACLAEDA